MNASEFYEYFYQGFLSIKFSEEIKQYSGTPLKWKVILPDAYVTWKITRNSGSSGLLTQLGWPGEFRCIFEYHKGKGKRKEIYPLSVFEITSEFSIKKYRALQVKSLGSYLQAGGNDTYGEFEAELVDYKNEKQLKDSSWCYYFDPQDAIDWGCWYARAIDLWIADYMHHYNLKVENG